MPDYEGPDLPVHSPDTLVATTRHLNQGLVGEMTGGYADPTFVRAVMVQLRDLSHAPGSAGELLERTDRELEVVAKACGALVVGHEWGLYPVEGKGGNYKRYLPANKGLGGLIDLPKGHILVAEVQTIRPATEWLSAEEWEERAARAREAVTAGVSAYYENGRYQLFDMKYDPARHAKSGPRFDHFMLGRPAGEPEGEPDIYLVDIDPRFSVTGR